MDLATYLRLLVGYGAGRGKSLIWPLRLGVRGLVIERRDEQDCVLLVRHTYISGWYLPGGGVEAGESVHAALARELAEEANVELLASPLLHGLFFNRTASQRHHVACYVVRNFRIAPHRPNFEIAEARFFPADALPEGTSRATRVRIAEVLKNAPATEIW
jgi:8-oxo-dGTP pyrophosphatase MutT (NUDIX family)